MRRSPLAGHVRLFAADLLLEAAELARRVEQVDALHGVGDLLLRVRGLGAGDELVALGVSSPSLPRMPSRPFLSWSTTSFWDAMVGSAFLASFSAVICLPIAILASLSNLSASSALAGRAQLVALGARGESLAAPVGGGLDVFGVVLLHEAQVADGLRDGALGLGDAVRVVTHQLVEHHLRVFGLVEQGVDVRAQELRDAPEDGLLCHGVPFFVVGSRYR